MKKKPIFIDREEEMISAANALNNMLPEGHKARVLRGWRGHEVEVVLPKLSVSRAQQFEANLSAANADNEAGPKVKVGKKR